MNITGQLRIVETYMTLGTGDYLNGTVGVTDFQLTATGNTLSISTLDGRQASYLTIDFTGYDQVRGTLTASGIVVLSGGTYSLTSSDTYRQIPNNLTDNSRNYYTLQGIRQTGSRSSAWDLFRFTNVYVIGTSDSVNSFTVTTLLKPIKKNLIDEFEVVDRFDLFNGSWKVVYSKMEVNANSAWAAMGIVNFYIEEASINPYLKMARYCSQSMIRRIPMLL